MKYSKVFVRIFMKKKRSLLRFIIVGSLGFFVNAILLIIVYQKFHVSLLSAQLVGAEAAIISNFTLHNRWTFRKEGEKSFKAKIVEFHLTSWAGAIITTLVLTVLVKQRHVQYLLALAVGGGIAMIWNYAWTRYVIWRPSRVILIEEVE